jgi:hypothetical protein
MKKQISLFLILCITMIACSTGVNKDFRTGLSVSYDGFKIDQAYLVGSDNNAITTNEVPINSEVSIVVQGVENYALKDGKAFPGLSLNVMDSKGSAVLDEQDLFDGTEGYPAADAAILRGTVTVGAPMKSGETYHVQMRIWDKNKTDNVINAEVDIKVK